MKNITYVSIACLLITMHSGSFAFLSYDEQVKQNKRSADFMEALINKDLDKAKLLLSQGINLNNQVQPHGNTPLTLAARYGYKDIVELLIKAGARVNVGEKFGFTPLALTENKEIAELLIKAGAYLEAESSSGGDTPLYWAVEKKRTGVVEALINARANVNFKDVDGRTVLFTATANGSNDIMKLLIKAGANVETVVQKLRELGGEKYAANLLKVAAEVKAEEVKQSKA